MKSVRWRVTGPHYADGWYLVRNEAAVIPELTKQWFKRRAAARAYRRALMAGRWKTARKILRGDSLGGDPK